MINPEIKNTVKTNIPIRCKLEVNISFIPTADNNAQPAGFKAFTTLWIYRLDLNLSRILKTMETIIKDSVHNSKCSC